MEGEEGLSSQKNTVMRKGREEQKGGKGGVGRMKEENKRGGRLGKERKENGEREGSPVLTCSGNHCSKDSTVRMVKFLDPSSEKSNYLTKNIFFKRPKANCLYCLYQSK